MAETFPNRIYQHAATTGRLRNTTTPSTLPRSRTGWRTRASMVVTTIREQITSPFHTNRDATEDVSGARRIDF
jgi:hypothetical protein